MLLLDSLTQVIGGGSVGTVYGHLYKNKFVVSIKICKYMKEKTKIRNSETAYFKPL